MGLLYLVKQSADASTPARSVLREAAQLAGAIGASTVGVMAADKLIDVAGEKFFKVKIPSYIRYAKKKHPELGDVSDQQLKLWVEAIYTLSPRMAQSKELVADALYQIYQYGGNIDLATAKIIADINKGSKSDNNIPYIAAGNSISGRMKG